VECDETKSYQGRHVVKYRGQAVAFLTQHDKETLLNPLFAEKIGCVLVRASGFDTDQLGTFTRDVPRPGTQLDAARIKANKAIALTGFTIGIGSEGAFSADPVGGMMPWNTEILVWIDSTLKIEIVGVAQGPGGGLQRFIKNENELFTFAADAVFPSHGLVLRPDTDNHPSIHKDFDSLPALLAGFTAARAQSSTGRVFAEVDQRAHRNPSRQQMILRAAEDLAAKILSTCPSCESPGYWIKERVAGLICGLCRQPTRMPIAAIWRCDICAHTDERRETPDKTADPARCDYCNP
jgi:hypothetical protein